MRPSLADLSPRAQAEAIAQLSRTPHPRTVELHNADLPPPPKAKKRIRQDSRGLNKLELRFADKLAQDNAGKPVFAQAIRLELARGHWYKPDFFLPGGTQGFYRPVAFEVKGPRAFRGGFENLKVAARVHQWCAFLLVWESAPGVWQQQEILA